MVRSLGFLSVVYRNRLRIEVVVNLEMPISIEKNSQQNLLQPKDLERDSLPRCNTFRQ